MVKKRTIWPYLLVAPAVLIILCVVFIPVFNAIVMSFQKYDLRRPKDIAFNGVANYMKAFGDPLFWNALWRTVGRCRLTVPVRIHSGPPSESEVCGARHGPCGQHDSMGNTWRTDRPDVALDL